MSSDYYDPHPLISLSQPLALVGHPGCGVSPIGRAISGRTGLPFNDIERSAEALAGLSRSQVAVEQGMSVLRRFERRALEKAVRRRPFGIIVMETGLFEDSDFHGWLSANSRVVYVRRPEGVLLERIRRSLGDSPGNLPEFVMHAPADPGALREYLAPRERALSAIDVIFEAGDESSGSIANQLLVALDRLVAVERH